MIVASFCKHNNAYTGFKISGHADFAEYGEDVACASVTSAVQCTINGICEILSVKAKVKVLENEIALALPDCEDISQVYATQAFIEALYLHLGLLKQDYNGTIKLRCSEV